MKRNEEPRSVSSLSHHGGHRYSQRHTVRDLTPRPQSEHFSKSRQRHFEATRRPASETSARSLAEPYRSQRRFLSSSVAQIDSLQKQNRRSSTHERRTKQVSADTDGSERDVNQTELSSYDGVDVMPPPMFGTGDAFDPNDLKRAQISKLIRGPAEEAALEDATGMSERDSTQDELDFVNVEKPANPPPKNTTQTDDSRLHPLPNGKTLRHSSELETRKNSEPDPPLQGFDGRAMQWTQQEQELEPAPQSELAISQPPTHKEAAPSSVLTEPPGDLQLEPDRVDTFAKQIRLARKLTDSALLTRTKWRHEFQKMDSSRRFLFESTQDLITAVRKFAPSKEFLSPLKGEEVREGEAGKDTTIRNLALQSSPKDDLGFSEAETGTTNALEFEKDAEQVESNDVATPFADLSMYRERGIRDYEALSEQEDVMKKIMEDMSNIEFRLGNLLKVIQKSLHSTSLAKELRSDMLKDDATGIDTVSASSSRDTLPSLVAEYFERLGDVGVYSERLQDLDHTYGEGLVEREFLVDRGEKLPVSDEDFHRNYRSQRGKIENEIAIAKQEAELFALQCEEKGLDPEAYRRHRHSGYTATRSASDYPIDDVGLQDEGATSEPEPHRHASPRAPDKAAQEIKGWLHGVPDISIVGPDLLHPRYPEPSDLPTVQKLSEVSLASFEQRSFDLSTFGLPRFSEFDLKLYRMEEEVDLSLVETLQYQGDPNE